MERPLVLLVEDDPHLGKLLSFRLGKQYDVLLCTDGKEALESIRVRRPDLILCDIMLPTLDGYQIRAALLEEDATKEIPFVFVTARIDEKSREKGLAMGADDYFIKPFDLYMLEHRVARLLARESQQPQA